MSPELEVLTSSLRSEPTIANAFRAWVQHCQETLPDPSSARSAKNFARAFQIWFDKVNKPDTCKSMSLDAAFLVGEVELFADDLTICDDPITERLNPTSKTSRLGVNCTLLVKFLADLDMISLEDVGRSLRSCTFMVEDLKRTQRATWVLFQYDIFFHPKLAGSHRPVELADEEVEGLYEITVLKDNFVLAEKRDIDLDAEPVVSPDDPIKIQVPRVVASLLLVGDVLHVGIRKAATADYWVITSALGVEPGNKRIESSMLTMDHASESGSPSTELKAQSREETLNTLRKDEGYQRRMKARLELSIPDDGFPNEMYTEEWFTSRELDFSSDDEVTGFWDLSDDSDFDELDDDDGDDI